MRLSFVRRSAVPLACMLSAIFLDCAPLTPLAAGTCGNGVVDANEDCDSFPAACGGPTDGARACRYVCDRTVRDACPAGWGCGVDGVCREATGTFANAGASSSAGIVTLAAGDFDGDGRSDLLGSGPKTGVSKPRVHFYDSSATPETPVSLPVPMSSPVVTDFDRDGRADLAFAVGSASFGGIGVLAGTADRTFSQRLFPVQTKPKTDARFVVIPKDPDNGYYLVTTPAVFTVERDEKGTFFRTFSVGQILGADQFELASAMGPEQVVGQLGLGHVFNPPPNQVGCGDVVVPYNVGDVGHVAIVSPCQLVGEQFRWAKNRPVRDVVLPGKVTGKLLVANIDGVGNDDIAVMTSAGLALAFSTGDDLVPFDVLKGEGGGQAPAVLAVGDIDRDPLASNDVVTESGAFLSVPQPASDAGADPELDLAEDATISPDGALWADARIANINGDDLPDVVAVAPAALELEVHAGAGRSLFTRFAVSSTQPIRAFTIGDFDGDRVGDIAFLASPQPLDAPEGSQDTELFIAFGRATGGPEAARSIARFPGARGLSVMHDAEASVDNLFVLESTPVAGGLPTTSMTFVINDGDRQSIAPLILRDEAALDKARAAQARIWLPVSVVAGPFVQKDSVDVLSIAFGLTVNLLGGSRFELPFPTGTWFARGDTSVPGGLTGLKETFRFGADTIRAIDDADFLQGRLEALVVSATGDVDAPPDGVHEVVSLVRTPGADSSDLVIVRPTQLGEGTSPPKTVRLSGFSVRAEDELQLLDVDGDERPDAVVLVRGDERGRAGSLRVYLNDGAGSFRDSAILLDAGPSPFEPVAVAQVTIGAAQARPRRALAVAGRSRLALAELSADRSKLEARDLTALLGQPLTNRISAVAAGDWDGDGVQDLAIADSGAIRLVLQQPRRK